MQANSFTLESAREHEAHLLRLAAPIRVVPPRRLTQRRRRVWILRRLRGQAVSAALDGGA